MSKISGLPAKIGFKKKEKTEMTSEKLDLPEGFSVTAHAGAMGLRANTLAALKKAIEFGVDIVEMDVTFRSDHIPVIIHSEKPRKNQGVLFEDALKLVAGYDHVMINMDLKSFVNLTVIEELVIKNGLLNRVFFTGVSEETVRTVQTHCQNIPMYLNVSLNSVLKDNEDYAQTLAEKLISLGCIGLNCNFGQISKTIVDVIQKNTLLVSVWTVDEEPDMYKMLLLAVDNITTRKPDKLKAIIESVKI